MDDGEHAPLAGATPAGAGRPDTFRAAAGTPAPLALDGRDDPPPPHREQLALPQRDRQAHLDPQLRVVGGAGDGTPFEAFSDAPDHRSAAATAARHHTGPRHIAPDETDTERARAGGTSPDTGPRGIEPAAAFMAGTRRRLRQARRGTADHDQAQQ